ncbi:hypothetical protein D5F01_LYC25305 [Larimichthys crocea]|uniref:F-box domain-containing protein n=1 Tax=Larimichthys crocea TaxID=215358 RepID=A0A6G0HCR2_LARCR|nr:hypothetical protein D5F01_LYC25305 [Larimichthys crocea]
MMSVLLQLPAELCAGVSFLSWRDKLSVRCTCSHFRHLLDKSRPLWRGQCRATSPVAVYNGRSGAAWLRGTWAACHCGQRVSITSCSTPLKNIDFLFPLSHQLTQLSLCNVQLTCPASHLLAAVSQLTRLTSLLLHHDGSLRFPTLSGVLTHLPELKHLSWTMITYKTLSRDFFRPADLTGAGGGVLQLSDLQLLNYDAMVTQEVLQPLSRLRSLSIFHLYSVPGPTCHLQTWLTSLPQLRCLSVHALELSSNLVRLLPQLFPHLRTLRIGKDTRHLQKSGDLVINDNSFHSDPAGFFGAMATLFSVHCRVSDIITCQTATSGASAAAAASRHSGGSGLVLQTDPTDPWASMNQVLVCYS